MEQITLYDLIGMKRKESVLKSVTISKQKGHWSGCYIEVEAYDDCFIRNTEYPSQQDKTYETITNAIIKYQDKIKEFVDDYSNRIDVIHYSTFNRHFQDLVLFDKEERKRKQEWVLEGIK